MRKRAQLIRALNTKLEVCVGAVRTVEGGRAQQDERVVGPCERGSLCPQMQLSCARDLTHQMGRLTAPVRTEMTTWHIQDSWTLWPSNLRPLCTQPGLFMETSAPAGEGSSLGLQKSTENPSSSFRALGRWHDHLHSQTRKLRLRKMAHPILSNGDREDYWGA